ncbi:MAG: hypothetical protein JXR76_32595 [Deltaproteobacteria bacterium]|nr:hypothetical protein [Deltaproteobacteria bacterium]
MEVFRVEDKLTVFWRDDVKAIVDEWQNYAVTLAEFKNAVLNKGLTHAKANNGIAWIVDSSNAKGAFTQEIQNFIGTELFPAFAKNGIKYFITVLPQSGITKLTVKNYSRKAGPNGLELVEAQTLDAAIDFLNQNK